MNANIKQDETGLACLSGLKDAHCILVRNTESENEWQNKPCTSSYIKLY